jgi:hypothetical protein
MSAPDEPSRVQTSVVIPPLVVEAGGQTWRITPDRSWLIGRAAEADIRLDDPRVSRNHATVTPAAEGWVVTNDGTNGMFVAGQRVARLTIGQQAEIALGDPQGVAVRFRRDGAGAVDNATQVISVPAVQPPVPAPAPAVQPPNSARPDWYPDPAGSGRLRYFTGSEWTDHFSPAPHLAQTPGAGRYFIKLHKHTGLLVLMLRQSYGFEGTLEQCEQAYRAAQTHNLLAGWWGVLSALVFNWIAIFSNVSAINGVRRAARQGGGQATPNSANPAGWYPDPSGAPRQRYWDGGNWTDHVS